MEEVMKLKLVLRQAFTEHGETERGRYFKETFCSLRTLRFKSRWGIAREIVWGN
jgi:hypothetical protein